MTRTNAPKKFRCIFLVVAIFISINGCGPQERSHEKNVVLEAYRLIDAQRTDEAIELLETSIVESPQNEEYKVVLASAYAHKAGVKVQTLVPAFNQAIDSQKKISSQPSLQRNESESESQRIDSKALLVSGLFFQISKYFEIYSAIPTVTPEQAIYLVQAISILNKLDQNIKPEDALYRAVLEVILFKHQIAENLIGDFMPPVGQKIETCSLDVLRLNMTIGNLGKLLIDIFSDVAFANPNQAESMKKLVQETNRTIQNIGDLTTTVTALDEGANLFLKHSLIQNGFGKIMKCRASTP